MTGLVRFLLALTILWFLIPTREPEPIFAASEYKLPVTPEQAIYVTQGNNTLGHNPANGSQWAFDFATAGNKAFTVVAARAGKVIGTRSDSSIQCRKTNEKWDGTPLKGCWKEANFVLIDHGDSTAGLYLHFQTGPLLVKEGQVVAQGQPIGTAGTTGLSSATHLHFQVEKVPSPQAQRDKPKDWWWTQSVKLAFSDKNVLAKNPDGVPTSHQKFNPYTSDNAPSVSTSPTTPMPVASTADQPISLQSWSLGEQQIIASELLGSPVSWSPDGKMLAWLTGPESYPDDFKAYARLSAALRVAAADGSTPPVTISTGPYLIEGFVHYVPSLLRPLWSPDGQWLAVTRYGDDAYNGEIEIIRRDGSQHRRLKATEITGAPSWSSDGKRIVATGAEPGRPIAVLFDMASSARDPSAFRLPSFEAALGPLWQPGGDKVIYTALTGPTGADKVMSWRLLILDTLDARPRELVAGQSQRLSGALALAWSPKGDHVAYAVNDIGDHYVPAQRLFADTGGHEPLFANQIGITRTETVPSKSPSKLGLLTTASGVVSWSPDGTKLAFDRASSGGGSDIFITDADGSNETQLTNNGKSRAPQWSPDGKRIAAAVDGRGGLLNTLVVWQIVPYISGSTAAQPTSTPTPTPTPTLASALSLDQQAAQYLLGAWMDQMNNEQGQLGLKKGASYNSGVNYLKTEVLQTGNVGGRPITAQDITQSRVSDDSNYIRFRWISESWGQFTSSGQVINNGEIWRLVSGEVEIRNIRVSAKSTSLSAADRANGVAWRGTVAWQFIQRYRVVITMGPYKRSPTLPDQSFSPWNDENAFGMVELRAGKWQRLDPPQQVYPIIPIIANFGRLGALLRQDCPQIETGCKFPPQ